MASPSAENPRRYSGWLAIIRCVSDANSANSATGISRLIPMVMEKLRSIWPESPILCASTLIQCSHTGSMVVPWKLVSASNPRMNQASSQRGWAA